MSELATDLDAQGDTVAGGGGMDATVTHDPVAKAVTMLELLSPEAREGVLARMDPAIAERIRTRLETMPDDRPHAGFGEDLAERRRMLREMAGRMHTRRTEAADLAAADLAPGTHGGPTLDSAPPLVASSRRPSSPNDALDMLRTLHPAAIARAMQGERAEAWTIVLDRLDTNAQAALQLYLDAQARAAIQDARVRQAELREHAPALITTIEAAIARTVVPRAMREHQLLLSTTPMTWQAPTGA